MAGGRDGENSREDARSLYEEQELSKNVCYEDVIPEKETEGLKELKDSGFKSDELFLVTRNTDKELYRIRFVPLWEWLLRKNFF